jgi:hypothetical protein
MSEMKRIFKMTEDGNLEDILGINIKRSEDGSIKTTWKLLIDNDFCRD